MSNDPTAANRPLRVFEKVLDGGLGAGNVGVVVSRHGTGKQALLTLIAVDKAMSGDNVLLVSADKSVSDVRNHRDEVLSEVANSIDIQDRAANLTKVERHTRIHAYKDGQVSLDRLRQTLAFAKEHAEFEPKLIEFQGWPSLDEASDAIGELKSLAGEIGCEIWITVHIHRDTPMSEAGLVGPIAAAEQHLSAVVAMEPEGDQVPLNFLRVHGKAPETSISLTFDPKTQLLRWN